MMSKWDRLEMAAYIQEADDVYTTKDGFGIVCVKDGMTRAFALEEILLPKNRPVAEATERMAKIMGCKFAAKGGDSGSAF